jgi:predicted nucleotidyltransferase
MLDRVSDTSPRPLRALIEVHRDEIKAIVARHKGTSVALFGSVARGDETAESDIDFLVDMEPGSSLLDLGGMLMDLRDQLGHDVDVVSLAALDERDDDIREDAVLL